MGIPRAALLVLPSLCRQAASCVHCGLPDFTAHGFFESEAISGLREYSLVVTVDIGHGKSHTIIYGRTVWEIRRDKEAREAPSAHHELTLQGARRKGCLREATPWEKGHPRRQGPKKKITPIRGGCRQGPGRMVVTACFRPWHGAFFRGL